MSESHLVIFGCEFLQPDHFIAENYHAESLLTASDFCQFDSRYHFVFDLSLVNSVTFEVVSVICISFNSTVTMLSIEPCAFVIMWSNGPPPLRRCWQTSTQPESPRSHSLGRHGTSWRPTLLPNQLRLDDLRPRKVCPTFVPTSRTPLHRVLGPALRRTTQFNDHNQWLETTHHQHPLQALQSLSTYEQFSSYRQAQSSSTWKFIGSLHPTMALPRTPLWSDCGVLRGPPTLHHMVLDQCHQMVPMGAGYTTRSTQFSVHGAAWWCTDHFCTYRTVWMDPILRKRSSFARLRLHHRWLVISVGSFSHLR